MIEKLRKLRQAEKVYYEATKNLVAIAQDAFPKGNRIRAHLGHELVDLRVTGHGVHHECGVIYASDLRTGRFHRIFPSQIV